MGAGREKERGAVTAELVTLCLGGLFVATVAIGIVGAKVGRVEIPLGGGGPSARQGALDSREGALLPEIPSEGMALSQKKSDLIGNFLAAIGLKEDPIPVEANNLAIARELLRPELGAGEKEEQAAEAELARLPLVLLQFLKAAGVKGVILGPGRSICEYHRSDGCDTAGGLWNREELIIHSDFIDQAMIHEAGHALHDRAFLFTVSDEFQSAFEADLPTYDAHYHDEPEAFAEAFSLYYQDADGNAVLHPRTIEFFREFDTNLVQGGDASVFAWLTEREGILADMIEIDPAIETGSKEEDHADLMRWILAGLPVSLLQTLDEGGVHFNIMKGALDGGGAMSEMDANHDLAISAARFSTGTFYQAIGGALFDLQGSSLVDPLALDAANREDQYQTSGDAKDLFMRAFSAYYEIPDDLKERAPHVFELFKAMDAKVSEGDPDLMGLEPGGEG